jgi:DNA-directed RNA polymerase specialized sigma24 family protein
MNDGQLLADMLHGVDVPIHWDVDPPAAEHTVRGTDGVWRQAGIASGADTHAAVARVSARVCATVGRLPRHLRAVVNMYYVQGLTDDQIAGNIGTSRWAALARRKLALKMLRIALAPVLKELEP